MPDSHRKPALALLLLFAGGCSALDSTAPDAGADGASSDTAGKDLGAQAPPHSGASHSSEVDAGKADGSGPATAGAGATPPRDTAADSGSGTPCDSDRVCTPLGLLCDSVRGRCADCVLDRDCDDSALCLAGRCIESPGCNNSLDCVEAPDSQAICEPTRSRCVQCTTTSDCDADATCLETRCRRQCDSDKDCTPLGQLCEFAAAVCITPGELVDLPDGGGTSAGNGGAAGTAGAAATTGGGSSGAGAGAAGSTGTAGDGAAGSAGAASDPNDPNDPNAPPDCRDDPTVCPGLMGCCKSDGSCGAGIAPLCL